MFGGGYFPAYFADAYFPHGATVVTDRPSYFPHSEFPVNFYPDPYFPGAPLVLGPPPGTRPSYFSHSVFTVQFYPDPYFPGAPLVVVPPVPPTQDSFGGGRFHPRPLPREVVHALIRLRLPVPRIQVRATYLPPTFDAAVRLEWAYVLEALATASPADIRAALQAVAPWVDVEQVMVDVLEQRRRKRQPNDDDELEAHYMASLGLYRGES